MVVGDKWIHAFSEGISTKWNANGFVLGLNVRIRKENAQKYFKKSLDFENICSRKNFVFLFGPLINLTVRVDAYFHPIRMTYPIQPGSFFRAAPNWEKPAKHYLPRKLSNWTDVITVSSPFSSNITTPWGKRGNNNVTPHVTTIFIAKNGDLRTEMDTQPLYTKIQPLQTRSLINTQPSYAKEKIETLRIF